MFPDEGKPIKAGWTPIWRTDCFPCVPARYVLAIASCLGFVNVYALRVNLSVAIVQMDGSTGANRSSTRVSETIPVRLLQSYEPR